MATDNPQRAYQAPCPGCGAPVAFRSAQSTHAVCGYCQSTVVRDGETLKRLGKMAELFEDFSPLQLMASGRWQDRPFTLVGRLQYQYAEGRWTEWYALLDDGSAAYLAEDNGAYVFAQPAPAAGPLPQPASLKVGSASTLLGKAWTVTSVQLVQLLSAQGELPHLPPIGTRFPIVELRSGDGEVLSIDYGTEPPSVARGHAVALESLALRGLREASGREDQGRQFSCPNCGAPVALRLDQSKSVVCGACNSIIDMSQGIGGELRHATQDAPVQPLIPLGASGRLQGADWQVVGFQHRMGTEPDDPDEQFGWSEYLLYNRQRGFSFLVDATDGWSLVAPTTAAPQLPFSNAPYATYKGKRYDLKERYAAETTYVAGEFYWQVRRGQKTQNRDFAHGRSLLSLEQSQNELTWSAGDRIDATLVAQAFKLDASKALFQRSDAAPLASNARISIGTLVIILLVLMVLLVIMSNCSGGQSYGRSSGGSFGGYSTGGGHK